MNFIKLAVVMALLQSNAMCYDEDNGYNMPSMPSSQYRQDSQEQKKDQKNKNSGWLNTLNNMFFQPSSEGSRQSPDQRVLQMQQLLQNMNQMLQVINQNLNALISDKIDSTICRIYKSFGYPTELTDIMLQEMVEKFQKIFPLQYNPSDINKRIFSFRNSELLKVWKKGSENKAAAKQDSNQYQNQYQNSYNDTKYNEIGKIVRSGQYRNKQGVYNIQKIASNLQISPQECQNLMKKWLVEKEGMAKNNASKAVAY